MTISPVPPDNAPPPSALDVVVQTAMLGSWLALLGGIATRRRFLFGASIAGGAVLAGAGLLCLATGHTGMWIAAQIGAGIGLAGLGYGASRVA
jgi:CHASE2 domain-containing sensor protein